MAEAQVWLDSVANRLEVIRLINGLGVWTHLLVYAIVLAFVALVFYVWVKTRVPMKEGGRI